VAFSNAGLTAIDGLIQKRVSKDVFQTIEEIGVTKAEFNEFHEDVRKIRERILPHVLSILSESMKH
jgi:hypothetical protein